VGDTEVAAASVSLREGGEIKPVDLSEALLRVEPELRPAIVRVVDGIPVTKGRRLLTSPLREEGVPPAADGKTYYRDRAGAYRLLTETARRRVLSKARPTASPGGSA